MKILGSHFWNFSIFQVMLVTKALAMDDLVLSSSSIEHEITNEDSSLDVRIDPPIRLNIFETSPFISEKTVSDILNATSTFATRKVGEYFQEVHGDTYLFDKITFKAITVESIVRGVRRLRSFEREEDEVKSSIRRENGMDASDARVIYMGDERDLQEEEYGTSIVLGGNVTFAFLPAASSQECNKILGETMLRYWGLNQAMRTQKNPELSKVTTQGLSTEVMSPEPTPSPTDSPTLSPTKNPTTSPTRSPTKNPTVSPTRSPTKNPTLSPTLSPTSSPTISRRPDWTDHPSVSPSISNQPSVPTPITGIITDRKVGRSMMPMIISAVIAFVVVAIVGFVYMKRRRNRQNQPRLIHLGDDNDYDPKDKYQNIVGVTSTKDDSLDSGHDSASGGIMSENGLSQRGMSFENSIASGATLKAGNGYGNENNWSQNRSFQSTAAARALDSNSGNQGNPLTDGLDIESQQNANNTSSSSRGAGIQSPSELRSPSQRSALPPFGPGLRAYFDNDDIKTSASSLKVPSATSSPLITVTPSKVSEEEFGKDWDADIPFNWKPTSEKPIEKKPSPNNKKNDDEIDVDGSFPTFDMADDPPVPTRPKSSGSNVGSSYAASSRSYAASSRSNADSSFHTTRGGLHPQDWSNKGSEYDGVSIGGSTITDVEDEIVSNEKHFDWNGSSPNKSGVTEGGAYMTPMSQFTRKTNATKHSVLSDMSPRSMNPSSKGSSPSSKGSGKQLINDLVWLEKKIADVRARVDRLDGDESQATGSPPDTPSTVDHKMGSPITATCGIICRDVIAPPGKLRITIHSTKDGPAIHSVKEGSILEGHIFSGDLIVAVDDTDTRAWSAEDVMAMMSQSSSKERKLTVLHASGV